MFLRDELTDRQIELVSKVLPFVDDKIEGSELRDIIGLTGHLYEISLMVYIQAMIAEGGKNAADMVRFVHDLNEKLNSHLIAWARDKGKENGRNAPSLIQVPKN